MESLIKKRNKILIIFAVANVIMVTMFTIGGVNLDNNPLLGGIIMGLGLLIEILTTIFTIVKTRKINNSIQKLKVHKDKIKFETKNGNVVFKTINKEDVEFLSGYFLLNGKINYYKDYMIYAATRLEKEIIACLALVKDNKVIMVDLDGDLLDVINKCEINVFNRSDLDYYLENIYSCNKVMTRKHAFMVAPCHVMEFKKTEEDTKRINKNNRKTVLFTIVSFLLMFGIYALISWLSNTESGNDFSDLIRIDIIFKIAFSIGILMLAFYKANEIKLYEKIITIAYLISYWAYVLFLSDRVNVIISLIFLVVFTYISIQNIKTKEDKRSRFVILAIFLGLVLAFNMLDICYVDENKPLTISAIIMGIVVIIAHVIFLIYTRSVKWKKLEKKEKVSHIITVSLGSLMFGFIGAMILISNLNYALDFSKPQELTCEIVDKKQGDDDSSDELIVIIDGKEIGIPIDDSSYFDYIVGEEVVVLLYDGAFGLKYYVIE